MNLLSLRTPSGVVALATLVFVLLSGEASAAVTQKQAERKAISSLKLGRTGDPVVVFRHRAVVPRGTAITQAGAAASRRASRAAISRDKALGDAGVKIIKAPVVLRAGEAAWFFYEDQAPYQAYEHPGRVVLVGRDSGRVTISKTLNWPPLIGGKLPAALTDYASYRSSKYQAFARSWVLDSGAASTARRAAAPKNSTAPVLPSTLASTPEARAARRQAAELLAAEKSCAIRISDTLGDFYDAGPVDNTRAALGLMFRELATLAPGFETERYTYREGDRGPGITPEAFIAKAIAGGCRDVLVYIAGGGTTVGGQPAVNIGTKTRAGGRLETHTITASALRAIITASPAVTFKVEVDAPRSGSFLDAVGTAPNLLFAASSSTGNEGSFTALDDVVDPTGAPSQNTYNSTGLLEFTNRQLQGLGCFLSSPEEVAAGARAKAQGRSRSFFAWMLARSLSICGVGYLPQVLQNASVPKLTLSFPAPKDADLNQAPYATPGVAVTDEDTPLALTLLGTDADGDPLTYAIVDAPTKGTLAGSGASRTYTPNADATGEDRLTFTVGDGQVTSAPVAITITIRPVNDAPVLRLGGAPTTFSEAGPAVAADPGLTIADVDDARLVGATVAIGAGFASGQDELAFTAGSAITGSYAAASGVLTLTGDATVAEYQAALRTVTFSNPSTDLSSTTRELVFRANDGDAFGASPVRPVAVSVVNDAPVLGGTPSPVTYVEDDAAGVAVWPTITVADVDSPSLAGATVRITTNLEPTQDELVFADGGGITHAWNPATGTLTLSGSATVAAYQAALRAVRYRNTDVGDPETATRTVSFAATDGAVASNTLTSTVDVTLVNDAPVVTTGSGTTTFTEGGGPEPVAPAATVVDADDATLTGADVRIATGLAVSQDALAFTPGSGITGTYTAATGVLALTGSATPSEYEAVLRTVTYVNSSEDPTGATRTITFEASDADGAGAATPRTVAVVAVDDAAVLGGPAPAATFVEDDTNGVLVAPALTISDIDSTTVTRALVTITTNRVPAEDRLLFSDGNGITGTYTAATGVLELSGSATLAEYQAAVRSVRYRNINTGGPSAAARGVTIVAGDPPAIPASNTITGTIAVTGVNDPPVVTTSGASPAFTEGGAPVAVDPAITVSDADSTTLLAATVSITGGFEDSEDVLALAPAPGLTPFFNTTTGVLTIVGSASPAAYQAALRTVTFEDTDGDDPDATDRTLSIAVTDDAAANATSTAATSTVRVVPVNDAPVLTATAGSAAFVEDAGNVPVDPAIGLADVDDTNLAGATVQITGAHQAAEDVLAYVDVAPISGAWNAATGTLTLSGTASVAAYRTALRSVTFSNTSNTPNTAARTVTFSLSDAAGLTATATRGVTVAAANDIPVVTAGAGANAVFSEGGGPVVVDDAVTVSDADGDPIVGATVCVCGNAQPTQDRLDYTTTNGIAGIFDVATGILTLSGSASAADYVAALRSVEYRNVSSSPSVAARRIDTRVSDASSTSLAASRTVNILSDNTAPTLTGGDDLAYVEDDPATPIDTSIVVTDPDDDDLDGATIRITTNAAAEDELVFATIGSISGAWNAATKTLTLTGVGTKAAYQAALRTVAYVNNEHETPSSLTRTVEFTVTDGEVDSNATQSLVTVAQSPDSPVVTAGTGNVKTFTENGTAVVVDDAIAVADPDSTQLSRATVSISAGFSQAQGDVLAFTPGSGISSTYDAATGVLELSGTATLAQYQTALRTVRFANTSNSPTTSRTVRFIVSDEASVDSVAVTHAVTIAPVNDAPVLAGGGTLGYTENAAATAISPLLTVSDADDTTAASATVAITGAFQTGEDVLSFTPAGGITGSYNATTGILTLSGSSVLANWQTVLRSVAYANSSDTPDETARTITYALRDTGSPAETGSTTATVNVTAVNDAPLAGSDADTAVGNTRLAYGTSTIAANRAGRARSGVSVLTNDTDVDGPAGPLTVDVADSDVRSSNAGGVDNVSWNADGTFTYDPPAGFVGTDFLTYAVEDGAGASSNGTVTVIVAGRVWYVDNTAAAAGDGRSSQPFDTLAEADAAANATGDRIYVHEGDGTATSLTGGVTLLDGQQLIGQTQDLSVAGNLLFDGQAGDRPAIAGTVAVEDGNTVTGLRITAATGDAAIDGNGDAGGTLADLDLRASGIAGTALKLNATTGTWNVSDTAITTTAAGEGMRFVSAGTVNFVDASTITIDADGRALFIQSTATSGTIDRSTSVASPVQGIYVAGNTGSLTLDDIAVTTAGVGLTLSSTQNVAVRTQAGARGTISSQDTAVSISSGAPSVALSSVSSTGGSRGINITGSEATFSAPTGTLSGHSLSEIGITGGAGAVSYGGTIGNGSGYSATVNSRTGGAVTLSGSITDSTDSLGGIQVTGNTGGSTTFSGTSKVMRGAFEVTPLIEFNATSGNHALNFAGGGLTLTRTSGAGIVATSAFGTITVQGTGNTITSGTGTALTVNGPDIGAGNVTFDSVATNSATNGILLADTGTAGGLRVTGTGSPGTGGTIQNSGDAGISLTNTKDVQLTSLNVTNGGDDGIRGTNVNGFILAGSPAVTGNGNAVNERGIDMTDLSGTVAITGAAVTGNADDNLAVVNDAATLTSFVVDGGSFGNNSSSFGNDGILLSNNGTGNTTGAIRNAAFANNRGDHIQIVTDNSTTTTQTMTVEDNTFRGTGNQPGNTMVGGGISIGVGGNATQTVVLDDNDIERAYGSGVSFNAVGAGPVARWTMTDTEIGTLGEARSGSFSNSPIYWNVIGNGTVTALIERNTFSNTRFGIAMVNNDGDATVNATVRGNQLLQVDPTDADYGFRWVLGSDATDNGDGCLDLGGAGANKNSLFATGQNAFQDIRVRLAGDDNDLLLPGYGGGLHDNAAVASYLAARNDGNGTPTVSMSQVDSVNSEWRSGGAACPLP